MFYRFFKCVVLVPLLRWPFRPRIEGLGHVPTAGGAIVAGNHQSFCDQFLLGVTLKRRINFLAKMEYFTGKGLKGRLAATFFRGIGAIPVDRSGNGAGQAGVDSGLAVLRGGGLLGIFPEGTRSHDGRLYKGRVGVAAMALRSGAPVVPCAMIGTFEAQPAGRRVPSLVPLTLRFGEPLDFSRYAGMQDQRAALRAVTDEIMYAILVLSGQEYVDQYAVDAKAEARTKALAAPAATAPQTP
ncbi:lysophospholipid acyltransferase family protein [Streptomyces flavofungini]|uniref:1-acyl-sn-glycerol-3-phosphate acyltransferase n=1 Tax=Streptomyces flavofungini TaxID=68200 RepID=A0ABS0XC29_9ACTN|nr:lysophospholipid acyltransferase family protein [Streptomyces flavofungini]MBJ3810714.1 1-acyl-sn-glycerol-3-phosphate acyltransferase [Streptomyces flavofungini]GHC51815.1 1-acyl-sn-glycerol-3-phosphate acyltransferase [Streptomyces flavofungini]